MHCVILKLQATSIFARETGIDNGGRDLKIHNCYKQLGRTIYSGEKNGETTATRINW